MKAVITSAALLAACSNSDPLEGLPRGEVLVSDVCIRAHYEWPYLVNTQDSLLWISPCDGSIREASKRDGSVRILVGNEPLAAMLAADEGNVFWTRIDRNTSAGDLVTASRLGGDPVVLAKAQQEMLDVLPQQLVIDQTNVYRSEFSNILSVPKDGSTAQQVVARGNSGPFLAVDAEYIYWASLSSVHRQRKGTTVDEQLAQSGTIWMPIALTEHAVFFWNPNEEQLYRIDKATGTPEIVLHDWPATVAFVSDGVANLYWQSGSALVRTSEDGEVTPIVRLDGTAVAVAVDHDFIYWVENSTLYSAPTNAP